MWAVGRAQDQVAVRLDHDVDLAVRRVQVRALRSAPTTGSADSLSKQAQGARTQAWQGGYHSPGEAGQEEHSCQVSTGSMRAEQAGSKVDKLQAVHARHLGDSEPGMHAVVGEGMQGPEGQGPGGSTCCRTWPDARMPLPYWEDDVGTGVVDGGALEVEGGAEEVRAGRVVGGGGGGVGRWKITLPLGLSTAK